MLPVFPPIDMGSSSFICDPKQWMDRGRPVVSMVVVVCVGVSDSRNPDAGQYSAEWVSFVSALMPSPVECQRPCQRPCRCAQTWSHGLHRRCCPHDGGAEESHCLGVASAHSTGNADFSVRRVHREWWSCCSIFSSHYCPCSCPILSPLAPATASAPGGDGRACVGVLSGGCHARGCRAGLAHLP